VTVEYLVNACSDVSAGVCRRAEAFGRCRDRLTIRFPRTRKALSTAGTTKTTS